MHSIQDSFRKSFRTSLIAALAALVAATLAACSPPDSSSPEPAPAAQTAETSGAEAPAALPTNPAADPTSTPDAASGAASATADEPVEESAGTEDNAAAAGKDIILATPGQPAPARESWRFREGAHFRAFTSAQGTSSSPDKIEVAEIFWYGCPHCYNLEPVIDDWAANLPSDVSFVRIPVMWNPTNEIHARVFYTAAALGKLDEISQAMFRSIHVDNKMMTEEADIRRLFEQHGIPADQFNQTFRSFGVDSQLKRARDLTQRYRIKSVPILIVNGKYSTEGSELRSQQDLLAVAEELVERERQDRRSPAGQG